MKIFRFRPKPLTTRRKITLAAIAAVPVLVIITFGNRGILKRVDLELRRDQLSEQVQQQHAISDSLRSEIQRLKTDTAAVEQLAREKYGMVRPGERIYRVDE
jgi:cell division protein FtsB